MRSIWAPGRAPNLISEKTESGIRKSSGCNVAPPALLRCSVGPAVVQAVVRRLPLAPRWFNLFFRWLPLAPRWFKLFSGGPAVVQATFPVVAVGPAVVQAVFRCLPLAPRWFKLFSGGCRWPRGGSSCFPVFAWCKIGASWARNAFLEASWRPEGDRIDF